MSIIDGLENANISCIKLLGRELTFDERKILMHGYKCGMIEATNDLERDDKSEKDTNK
jgi:hypothetical protein